MNAPAQEDPLSPDTRNWWAPQRRRTWFGIAGGPLAWALHIAGGWYVSGNACLLRSPQWGPLSRGDVWMLEAFVAIVCIAIAAAALGVAVLDWRASANRRITEIQADARPDFLAAVALIVSSSFLLAVLYVA
ncbi:MAG: hypothetical protein ACHP7E_10430, partial [Burkholderiales bacterium]